MRKDDNGCLIAVIACGVLYFVFPLLITICNIEEVVRELKNGVINDTLSSLFSSSILLYLFFALCIAYAVFDENKNRFIAFWEKVLYVIFLNPITMLYAALISVVYIFDIGNIRDHANGIFYFMVALICIIVFLLLIYHFNNKEKCERAIRNVEDTYNRKEAELAIEYNRKENLLLQRTNVVSRRETLLQQTLTQSTPFKQCAKLYADFSIVLYDKIEEHLKRKSHPAYKAAEEVRACKARIKHLEEANKEFVYKYEYLVSVFPELEEYIGDDEALLQLNKEANLNSFLNDYDRTRNYISKEEWERMPENNRNQLAFERWKQQPKSKWTIGMLYEMYIAHILREFGYYVIDFGIRRGLDDLGRDIIATKVIDGKLNTFVIQCKNWSHIKEIHENVICQLYGTTLEYKLSHPDVCNRGEVYPMLITSTALSGMAKRFAEKLDVKVKIFHFDINGFPLIKCNINNGQKIYHLPFDQQYWNTTIDRDGEFYAWSIEEATQKGFRRAYRWHGKD